MQVTNVIKLLALLMLGVFMPSLAMASGKANAESLSLIAEIVKQVVGDDRVQQFANAAMPIANSLKSLSLSLAGTLAVIAITWVVIESHIKNKPVASALIEPMVFSSITALILGNYQVIVDDSIALSSQVIGAAGNTVSTAISSYIAALFTPFIGIVKAAFDVSFFDAILKAPDLLLGFIIALVAFAFGLLALVELVKVLITGPVAFGLGVAVGPLFVSTLPFSGTRKWFDQWINFLINAAMITAIAVIVVTMVSGIFNATATSITSGGRSSAGAALGLALFALALSSVFQSVPAFADALFPGRTGAGNIKSSSYKGAANAVMKSMTPAKFSPGKPAAKPVTIGANLQKSSKGGGGRRP